MWCVIKKYWNARYGHIRFRLYDINLLAFFGVFGLLFLFFYKHVEKWTVYFLIHLALIVFILEVIRLGERYPGKTIFRLARNFYLFAVMLFVWEECEMIIPIFHGSYPATKLIS
ncbi:MAG: hypothetical protein JXB26_11730 [Candidatus Aminicenantes bacterium]|nr:hypothetical protein [Candidatus Aminicenantes bacterium]